MLQADEGEGAGEDFPAGPAETLAEPEGGRAPEHLSMNVQSWPRLGVFPKPKI